MNLIITSKNLLCVPCKNISMLVNEAYCDEPVDKSLFLFKQTHTVLHVLFMIRIYIKHCICMYVCVTECI